MQPHHPTTPADAFTSRPTLKTIVAQIKATDPRALSPEDYEDVVTLLEYIRDETLKNHERVEEASKKLAERERDVTKRERDLAIRQRAVMAAAAIQPRRRWIGG